jgi:hypothetical protein
MMMFDQILLGTGRGTMPVLSDAAGGVEGRSMVEGQVGLGAALAAACPSTSLRLVPLPLQGRNGQ